MNQYSWRQKTFLLLLPFILLGQAKKNDLVKLSYKEIKSLYFKNENNKRKQAECAEAFVIKAKKESNTINIARGYYMHSIMNQDFLAISYLDSVIKYSKNTNDLYFPASAYCEKGFILKNKFQYKEAVDNFILAEKYAKKNNEDYYCKIRLNIAELKSEELSEVDEALVLYKECYKYYKSKNIRNINYSWTYHQILFDIADAYKSLHQSDSSTYYNKLGYKESKITKDEEMQYLFVLNEGANQIIKKNYQGAFDSINKALPKMILYKNGRNSIAGYYYLGKVYEGMGNETLAAKNYIKVDSIYQKSKEIFPELVDGYYFLIEYYKNKGNKEKQLQYLTNFMSIDSSLQKKYRKLGQAFTVKYEIPRLINNKEELIKSLKNDRKGYYLGMSVLLLLIIVLSLFVIYQHRLKRTYRERFEKIILNISHFEGNDTDDNNSEEIPTLENNNKKDIGIGDRIVEQILEKINAFEKRKGYLQSNITVQSLSEEFETNNKYVSRIINEYKNKPFIQYINDLRIEYAVVTLKLDNKLRKYTINALAKEFGFNNVESFSTAFYKKTGIKPTFFIKELEK